MRAIFLAGFVLSVTVQATAQISTSSPSAAPGTGGAGGLVALPSRAPVSGPPGADDTAAMGVIGRPPMSGVQPAHGANSFTLEQARRRIAAKGYTSVMALTKDQYGVWRGKATRDKQSVGVWLDYTGKVGQQS